MRLSLPLGHRGGVPGCIFPDVFHHTRDRLNFLRIKITGRVPPDFGQAASAAASNRHADDQRFSHGNSETFKQRWKKQTGGPADERMEFFVLNVTKHPKPSFAFCPLELFY